MFQPHYEHFFCFSRYVTVGRSFFSPPDGDSLIQLGHGREVWFGYHQSLRPSQWKMMVNLDICLTAFYKPQPIVDYLCEVLDKDFKVKEKRELFDYERLKFAKEVKGKKVLNVPSETLKHFPFWTMFLLEYQSNCGKSFLLSSPIHKI